MRSLGRKAHPAGVVVATFFASRVGILALAYLLANWTPIALDTIGVPRPTHYDDFDPWRSPLTVFASWDASHYNDIAENWYRTQTTEDLEQFRFFPLWPLVIKGVALLLPFVATSAISVVLNLAFSFLAVLVIKNLITAESLSNEIGERASIYLLIFPSAYVLSMGYSEGLFLFLSGLFLFLLRRGRGFSAAGIGFLAGLSRWPGALLGVAALVEAFVRRKDIAQREGSWFRKIVEGAAPIVAPVAGALTWIAYTGWRTGDPFLMLDLVQRPYFRGRTSFLPIEIFKRFQRLPTRGPDADFILGVILLGVLVALIYAFRVMPASFAIYGLASILFMTAGEVLVGGDRHALGIIPLFWALAHLGERRWFHHAYIATAPVLMGVIAILSWQGLWVP